MVRFTGREGFLIYPAWHADSPVFYSNAIVPCVVNQTHLAYFKWPGSATIVSHILQFIAVLRSLSMKEGGGGGGGGGMQWWRSRDLSHSTGGLCRGLLVPLWEIRERHEQAGWGESWSWPQIAPPGVVFTMVVCWQSSGSVLCPRFSIFQLVALVLNAASLPLFLVFKDGQNNRQLHEGERLC